MGRWGQQFRKRSCRHVPAYMIFQELVRRWLLLEEETRTAPEAELEELLPEKTGNLHCYE